MFGFISNQEDNNNSKKQSHLEVSKIMNQLEKEIYELAGEKFKIMSPKNVGTILFDKMKIIDNPKTEKYGTDQQRI